MSRMFQLGLLGLVVAVVGLSGDAQACRFLRFRRNSNNVAYYPAASYARVNNVPLVADSNPALEGSDTGSGVAQAQEEVTPEEQKLFDEMYAQLDLDENTRKVLANAWLNMTHAQRLAEYGKHVKEL